MTSTIQYLLFLASNKNWYILKIFKKDKYFIDNQETYFNFLELILSTLKCIQNFLKLNMCLS